MTNNILKDVIATLDAAGEGETAFHLRESFDLMKLGIANAHEALKNGNVDKALAILHVLKGC